MQLMTWTVARLGSRFSLLFEPARRRVMHSALGRFLDRPLDLQIGLVEPDGTRRVLPLCADGQLLANCEQFERLNSITFRGFSKRYGLRFEFNLHSVFYPQDEALCLMPAFYMEMRVNPTGGPVRRQPLDGPTPERVTLFIKLARPDTQLKCSDAGGGRIDLRYDVPLRPADDAGEFPISGTGDDRVASVRERIQSLNAGCVVDPDGCGLSLTLPVTDVGSGTKWRLVWGAFCGDPVIDIRRKGKTIPARLRYLQLWTGIDAVMEEAIRFRDDRLAHSRRFEKLVEQASLLMSQRHLLHQSFQSFLAATFWCDTAEPISTEDDPNAIHGATHGTDWFSVWDGPRLRHGALSIETCIAPLYLTLWPYLLSIQFDQWAEFQIGHDRSGGAYLGADVGAGLKLTGQAHPHDTPVQTACEFLLLMQAYAHWTGDLQPVKRHIELIDKLARYLIWCDRDGSGFASEGIANSLDEAGPSMRAGRKLTFMAVKRLSALRAAEDLLSLTGRDAAAKTCDKVVAADAAKIEARAWLGDHYAVNVDRASSGDGWGRTVSSEREPTAGGWDAYTIHTGDGLLLPALCGQPPLLEEERLTQDLLSVLRETLGAYGCGHSSADPENVWVSHNVWRDALARYMGVSMLPVAPRYWDLQVMSNTGQQSLGFCDSYVQGSLAFSPAGVASLAYLLSGPRIVIDKLAPGGARIGVTPDRGWPQRWPLLPLGDWRAGKIPVCVVSAKGIVSIECEIDPVIVHSDTAPTEVIG